MRVIDEPRQTLWILTFAPAIWAGHFLLSYVTTAIWCTRFTDDNTLGPVPGFVAVFTAAALAGIGAVAWAGWRGHRYGGSEASPHDHDSPVGRYRCLGFSALLLASLSALATIFVAGSALFFETCR